MLVIYLVRVNTSVTGAMDSINTTDITVTSSPGANVSAVTLVYMCHLFGFTKKWLQEGGVSTDIAIVSDRDTTVQRKNMFSDSDCKFYHGTKWHIDHISDFAMCDDNSLLFVADPESLYGFTRCITLHFMTEMEPETAVLMVLWDPTLTQLSRTQ